MMFKVQYADGSYSFRSYETEGKAAKALARRREVGSAVVWHNDLGIPKMWCGTWTAQGWKQIGTGSTAQ